MDIKTGRSQSGYALGEAFSSMPGSSCSASAYCRWLEASGIDDPRRVSLAVAERGDTVIQMAMRTGPRQTLANDLWTLRQRQWETVFKVVLNWVSIHDLR